MRSRKTVFFFSYEYLLSHKFLTPLTGLIIGMIPLLTKGSDFFSETWKGLSLTAFKLGHIWKLAQ